ncbi:MAG: hypothetical protein OXE86_10365 [Alphaproteobacteria bacterium]|nr:hypothetical protein [Alphaproteobacteria bacterium]
MLRDDPDGIERVTRAIRYLRSTARSRQAYKDLDRELNVFRKNRERMRYAELANNALSIGTSIVEAANKLLVTQRDETQWHALAACLRSGRADVPGPAEI